jgi:hypothetical protein
MSAVRRSSQPPKTNVELPSLRTDSPVGDVTHAQGSLLVLEPVGAGSVGRGAATSRDGSVEPSSRLDETARASQRRAAARTQQERDAIDYGLGDSPGSDAQSA